MTQEPRPSGDRLSGLWLGLAIFSAVISLPNVLETVTFVALGVIPPEGRSVPDVVILVTPFVCSVVGIVSMLKGRDLVRSGRGPARTRRQFRRGWIAIPASYALWVLAFLRAFLAEVN